MLQGICKCRNPPDFTWLTCLSTTACGLTVAALWCIDISHRWRFCDWVIHSCKEAIYSRNILKMFHFLPERPYTNRETISHVHKPWDNLPCIQTVRQSPMYTNRKTISHVHKTWDNLPCIQTVRQSPMYTNRETISHVHKPLDNIPCTQTVRQSPMYTNRETICNIVFQIFHLKNPSTAFYRRLPNQFTRIYMFQNTMILCSCAP